jgi:hypothetical protein
MHQAGAAGQFPADEELDIVHSEFSPGVRRMQALVGQDASFDHGREQMKLLAGLELNTKSVERVAESIGADIGRREQQEIDRAVQLDLPIVIGQPVPKLYIEMDGTAVPVVRKETVGRQGKTEGQPTHTREVKLGCVFTQTGWDKEGYAIRDPDSTSYVGVIETAEECGDRMDLEPRQSALPRRHADCRSLSCAPAPLGTRPSAAPERGSRAEALDGCASGTARRRQDEEADCGSTIHPHRQPWYHGRLRCTHLNRSAA